MGLTNAGRDYIAGRIVDYDPHQTGGAAPDFFDNATAAIGVGSSQTIFDASHTDLQAATYGTDKDKRPMESGYPTIATNVITFRSLFATNEANYNWYEWGVFNFLGESAPNWTNGEYMLNRKQEGTSLGLKTPSQSWQITVELTVQAG